MQHIEEIGSGDGRLLTVPEIADRLRVAPSTVYRWATAGTLRSVRFAGSVRVPADALDEFVSASPTDSAGGDPPTQLARPGVVTGLRAHSSDAPAELSDHDHKRTGDDR